MDTRKMMATLAVLCLTWAAPGCSDDTTTVDLGPRLDGGGGEAGGGLTITITIPTEGAKGVSVRKPELKATFSRPLKTPDELQVVLIKESKLYHGERKYSATNLDVVFTPFNMLESQATYTFKVSAEGAEAQASFTTEKANEGALPTAQGKTYDFRLEAMSYPKELGAVFNSQLQAAPPVLMHVVEVKDLGARDGNSTGTFTIAGSTGTTGPAGTVKVLPEDATHTTTTAMAIQGRFSGSWFGAGPSDLHLMASGIPLVIRDFFITGVMPADGSSMKEVTITGLIDPAELGKAIGGGIDLSFICTDASFKKFCDADQRIRVAATVVTVANPIDFSTFITAPVNGAAEVDPATLVQAYFSDEVDSTATTVKLTDAAGTVVSGNATFSSKGLSFKPAAVLTAKTKYTVEVAGVAKTGAATDTRHLTFTTR